MSTGLGPLDRSMQGLDMEPLDEYINSLQGECADYANAIADRNDYAIMKARTVLAMTGCRATRDRVMPA